jgi:hypothetical protein
MAPVIDKGCHSAAQYWRRAPIKYIPSCHCQRKPGDRKNRNNQKTEGLTKYRRTQGCRATSASKQAEANKEAKTTGSRLKHHKNHHPSNKNKTRKPRPPGAGPEKDPARVGGGRVRWEGVQKTYNRDRGDPPPRRGTISEENTFCRSLVIFLNLPHRPSRHQLISHIRRYPNNGVASYRYLKNLRNINFFCRK